jgi:tRNA pseudouridine55 synthase
MPDCANCPQAPTGPRSRWVAPKRDVPLSGILNIDKPPDMTSHDVVDVVRRVAGQRKVGHAGTLDPLASGVLLVCLGQATRIAEYLMASPKRYRATIVLGATTDTYDVEGEILTSGGRTDWSRPEIAAALDTFVGRTWQVPPMYSALKRGGQPLYKLARQGQTVEREPRPVDIAEILLLSWTPPALTIEVACSPGTYVRTLAHDLGQRLGCGAYLSALVRLSSGQFCLEEATSLERIEEAFEHGQEDCYLLPVDEALLDWPALILGTEDAQRLTQGQPIAGQPPTGGGEGSATEASPGNASPADGILGRAYGPDGGFLAIVTYQPTTALWQPKKVFQQPGAA